ncbi:MAG: hypothetical protein H6978_10140 [Gammaproteobacteria bacterium]|nr:hypothetical protein [Gammaproteobacteria bacterium]
MRPVRLIGLGFALLSGVALAHHSTPAHYDLDKSVALEGTVTAFHWRNPHAFIFLDVVDGSGTHTEWHIEMSNTIGLTRAGWTDETIKEGDTLMIRGAPARDESRNLLFIRALKRPADGLTYGDDYGG